MNTNTKSIARFIAGTVAAAGILNLVFRGAGLDLIMRRSVLFTLTSLGVILAVGCLVIGWSEFLHVLRFHKGIVFSSGLYGNGDQFVVNVWGVGYRLVDGPAG